MTTHVRAMYDFSGEPNTSELSIVADEILTLTRTDVGEGWWEGTNSRGQTGLFPEAYVQIHHREPSPTAAAFKTTTTAAATVAVPQQVTSTQQQQPQPPRYDQSADDWSEQQDDWEDDWDEDNETYSEIGPASAAGTQARFNPVNTQQHQQQQQQLQNNHQLPHYQNASSSLPPTPSDDTISMTSTSAPLKKSGIFAKSGDSYILGTTNVSVADGERVFINQVENGGYFWKQVRDPYNVRVASPKKETKFKGMKSFIAYQLTPSFNHIAVSRRYKHFDWLHERLLEKFCLIPIPPLPDKQISGRYEDQFVEHRRVQLQEFVDWVCRHPVLSICEVWMHFLTCTDEKRWKTGKRTAEKDILVGATYCAAIFPPEKQLLQSQVDSQTENCSLFVHAMDSAVKSLFAISAEQVKRYQMQWKKDFQRVGESFSELARALEVDERRAITNINLSNSVGQAAGVFISIGQMFGEQPNVDWIPFCDRLHIYRGVLTGFPDMLAVHRGAMQKRKECERLTAEQKMGNAQLQEVGRRTDIMSYAVLAEMNHFRQERDVHLKETMRNMIAAQIVFYQDIIGKLQAAQRFFE